MFNIKDERLVDFTNCTRRNGGYQGANGCKIQILYDDSVYMLKFPSVAKINESMHYTNGCISEYLGCHIFNEIGIPAQKTILGRYYANGEYKPVVACQDFTFSNGLESSVEILDFTAAKNSVIDSSGSGKGTELSDVLDAINLQNHLDSEMVLSRFWDMFIVDAFIGNWDRHNGNWGMLYEKKSDAILGIAPVFDCGSCLFPQADEKIMGDVINNPQELKLRIFERPVSALTINNKKINYYDYMTTSEDADFLSSVLRIVPRIDMNKIRSIIDNTPGIDALSKKFYNIVLTARKDQILDKSFDRAKEAVKNDCRSDLLGNNNYRRKYR